MEILKERHRQLIQAYARLAYMIKKFSPFAASLQIKSCENEPECIMYRDSLIKRFEFCFDVTWKFLKLYLEKQYGIEVASPKKVFQECIKQKLAPEDQIDILMEMVEARNNTSHNYNEAIAQEIAQKIPLYYDSLVTLISRISI